MTPAPPDSKFEQVRLSHGQPSGWQANLETAAKKIPHPSTTLRNEIFEPTEPASLTWGEVPSFDSLIFFRKNNMAPHHFIPAPGTREQRMSTKVEPAHPSPTFSAPGRYPDYFLANEDFLSTKSSQTMDYDMESKVANFSKLLQGGGGLVSFYFRVILYRVVVCMW